MKFQFLTGMHGNEPIPVISLALLGENQIVVNPKALNKGVRDVNMDMNQAFGRDGDLYEEKRAREVLKLLKKDAFVIDFHTTLAITEPFAIVVDKKMIPVASSLGLKHVVYMKHSIKKGHALINYCDGISVEVGNHDSEDSAKVVRMVVEHTKNFTKRKAHVYEVYGIISDPGEYVNFKKHKDSFYPVLAGETSYDFLV